MSAFEVHIDGPAINAAVTQAVLDSVVGEQMRKAIEQAIAPGRYGRDSAVVAVVKEAVQILVRNMILEEYAEEIKTAIREALAVEGLSKIVAASVEALMAQIGSSR